MRRLSILFLLFLLALPLSAQQVYSRAWIVDFYGQPTPSNPPTNFGRVYFDQASQTMKCRTSAGADCWGAGAGSVTSVTGTTNQITVTGTTAPVLSIPSTFIAPGSVAATTTLSGTSVSTTGSNGGMDGLEGTGAGLTAATNHDLLYPDSTAHRWKVNPNNAGATTLAQFTDNLSVFATGGSINPSAISCGVLNTTACVFTGYGSTSGTATITWPAVAGTSGNPIVFSNVITAPNGSCPGTLGYNFASNPTNGFCSGALVQIVVGGASIASVRSSPNILNVGSAGIFGFTSTGDSSGGVDTGMSRGAPGLVDVGTGAAASTAGYIQSGMTKILTADWTCGTGGTVSSCVTAQTIGTLTFTLPLVAANWSFVCDLVVGQATGATANNWSLQTATNGATNTMAAFMMDSAATALTSGAITGQGSTTSSFDITGTWTLGGTGTKMPAHIFGTIEGASASGTVFNLQLKAPTVGDLVTIYRGSKCTLNP